MDMQARSMTLLIPSSKTDIEGFGVRLRFACTCDCKLEDLKFHRAHRWYWCLVHSSAAYALGAHGSVNPETKQQGAEPFFVMEGARTLEALSEDLNNIQRHHDIGESDGEADEPEHVKQKYSAHSIRRTGAREWFRGGMSLEMLQRLGRWTSTAWAQYISGLPATVIIDMPEKMKTNKDSLVAIFCALRQLTSQVSALEAKLKQEEEKMKVAVGPRQEPRFIVAHLSVSDRKTHIVSSLTGRRGEWSARCGFKFGTSKCEVEVMVMEPSDSARCKDCFGLRAPRRLTST